MKAGALTWFGADTAAAWPAGMVTKLVGHYSSGEQPNAPFKGGYRKLGTFNTDAAVLAVAAEIA